MKKTFIFILLFTYHLMFSQNSSTTITDKAKPNVTRKSTKKVDDALSNILNTKKKNIDTSNTKSSNIGSGSGGGNGLGNGAGYSLTGRKVLNKPQPIYHCNEEGTVVVQITVDKNGNVIEAKPGARGTTNTASCLTSQAKVAAMNTKWSASADGAEKQVGTIRYNFSLKD